MAVPQKDLVDWARDYAAVLKERGPHTYDAPLSHEACLALTIEGQSNPELVAALKHVAKVSKEEGTLAWPEMDKMPDVFSRLFMIVFKYGIIYGDPHVTLERFANHPEEMAQPYYEEGTFPLGKEYKFQWRRQKPPRGWGERKAA